MKLTVLVLVGCALGAGPGGAEAGANFPPRRFGNTGSEAGANFPPRTFRNIGSEAGANFPPSRLGNIGRDDLGPSRIGEVADTEKRNVKGSIMTLEDVRDMMTPKGRNKRLGDTHPEAPQYARYDQMSPLEGGNAEPGPNHLPMPK
jgi:hypothetical protein